LATRLQILISLPTTIGQHKEKSMSIHPTAIASAAQNSSAGSVQVNVLKKAVDLQANAVLQLIQSVDQTPALATEGSVGTQVDTHA